MDEGHRTHLKIAEQAYERYPSDSVDGYHLVSQTPTLKIYSNGKEMIVGVRGTYDRRDVATDLTLAGSGLKHTQRYKDDREKLKQALDGFPGRVTTAGHSLGGAIADRLKHDAHGRISGGVHFNPAFEAKSLLTGGDPDVVRYYATGDPLSVIGGRTLSGVKWVDSGANGGALRRHRLDNFRR